MKKVENAEFRFDDGTHICWSKEFRQAGWTVTRYKHGEMGKSISTLVMPSIINAQNFYKSLDKSKKK